MLINNTLWGPAGESMQQVKECYAHSPLAPAAASHALAILNYHSFLRRKKKMALEIKKSVILAVEVC